MTGAGLQRTAPDLQLDLELHVLEDEDLLEELLVDWDGDDVFDEALDDVDAENLYEVVNFGDEDQLVCSDEPCIESIVHKSLEEVCKDDLELLDYMNIDDAEALELFASHNS